MKQIYEYLLSKSKKSYSPKTWKEKVDIVTIDAEEKGLKLIFRNRNTNTGDFTFFIYDKDVKKSYLVGFDGYWNSDPSFDKCLEMTKKFIENYKKPKI